MATQGAAYVFTLLALVFNDFAGNGRSGALFYDPSIGQSYTALSNGNGTYSYVPNLFTAHFDTLRTGDFNGDGKADLVVYNSHTALGLHRHEQWRRNVRVPVSVLESRL